MLSRPIEPLVQSGPLMSLYKSQQENESLPSTLPWSKQTDHANIGSCLSGQPAHDNIHLGSFHLTFLPGRHDKKSKPLLLILCLAEVEKLLEGLWKASQVSKSLEKSFPGLSSIYQSYTDSEKLSIQNQISLLEIPSEGLRYALDPKVCLHGDRQNHGSVTVEAAPLQTSLNDRMSLRSSAAVPIHCASYADILNLLLKKYSYLQLQKIPFRLSGFSKDIYGLLHESPYGCANYLGC